LSSPRDERFLLADIGMAIAAIGSFVSGHDAERYFDDDLVRSAVERKFEIIGEALNGLNRLRPHLAQRIRGFREIIAFRNILAHGYASVDHGIVWRVIVEDLPALRATVDALLEEFGR